MAARGSAAFAVRVDGIDDVLRRLTALQDQALKQDANRFLRDNATAIAERMLPAVKAATAAGAAPQSAAVAQTARSKRDRRPTVTLGTVNPKISGMRRRGSGNRAARGSIAFGAVFGPAGGHRSDGAGRAKGANFYGITRDAGGGRLGAAMAETGPIFRAALREYQDVLAQVARAVGVI